MRCCHRTNRLFRRCCDLLLGVLLLPIIFVGTALGSSPSAEQYRRELIRESRAVWGLNAPVALFAAQIHQESQWNLRAVSPVGAQGLAQFMPATSKWIATQYPELAANNPFNPSWAMRALVQYNHWHWQRIAARTDCDRWAFVLSAYNGGLGWVQRDKAKAKAAGVDPQRYWGAVEHINAGRSRANFAENRGYPKQIIYRWQPHYIKDGWGEGVCGQ